MKKALFLLPALVAISASAFAQKTSTKNQFILIIRSNTVFPLSKAVVDTNISHWQNYMGGLAKNGNLAGGYRPSTGGETLSGADAAVKTGPFIANDMVVSSFLIINAKDLSEAERIAAKCPVFELKGSVEIRPIQNTAN